MTDRIIAENMGLEFKLYYDLNPTIAAKAKEFAKKITGKHKPKMFQALNGISFKAADGDIIGIIGPNGAGKTTLLRAICGIYHPDRGHISCNGRISMLLSLGTGFDNNLSGLDNIRLNGLICGMTAEEIDAKIPEIVAFAEIGDHIHMPMHYYSNGMISRLSFAIVVAMNPDILIIDEVFSVGDLAFRRKSEKAMQELMSRASCQVIVSHNMGFIREHCNKVMYMRYGEIVNFGDPEEVIAQYERECNENAPKVEDTRSAA